MLSGESAGMDSISTQLIWRKIRLDAKSRSIFDRAVADVNRKLGVKWHLIRHPSGKLTSCRVDDLWFCHVGDASPEPRVWTLAIDTRPEQRTLLPGADAADFDECCDILGFRTEAQRAEFRTFLEPKPVPPPADLDSGAV